jgi:hypothetical protein
MAYLGFSTHPPSPSSSLARTQTRKSLRGKSIFLSEALDGEECGGKKHRGVNAKQMNVHADMHTDLRQILVCLAGSLSSTQAWKTFLRFQPQSEQQNRIIIFPWHKIKYLPHNLQHFAIYRLPSREEKNMRILMASG